MLIAIPSAFRSYSPQRYRRIFRSLLSSLLASLFVSGAANAATCLPYTYNLTNGTTADASQVMNNFTNILNCANNNVVANSGGTLTGGTLAGTTTNTGSITGGAANFSTVFVGGSGPIDTGSQLELKQNNSASDLRSMIYNTASANSSSASLLFATGVTNANALNQLNNLSTGPQFSISLGSAVTNGIVIDSTNAAGAGISLKSNAPIVHTAAYADQSYSKQTPTYGFSITMGNTTGRLIIDVTASITGTVTLPVAPLDGQIAYVSYAGASSSTLTLALSAHTGQTIKNPISSLSAGGSCGYQYVASNSTWYRIQ